MSHLEIQVLYLIADLTLGIRFIYFLQVSTQTLLAVHDLSKRLGVITSIHLSTLSIHMCEGFALQLSANPSAMRHSITWTLRKIDSNFRGSVGEQGTFSYDKESKFGSKVEKRPSFAKKGRVVWEKSLGVLDMFSLHKIIVKVVQKQRESHVVNSDTLTT